MGSKTDALNVPMKISFHSGRRMILSANSCCTWLGLKIQAVFSSNVGKVVDMALIWHRRLSMENDGSMQHDTISSTTEQPNIKSCIIPFSTEYGRAPCASKVPPFFHAPVRL